MSRALPLTALCVLLTSVPVHGQGFSPEEAVRRMQLPEGFTAKLVACEPMIRQPLSIDFDEKGRMWVLQYLQYPNPAGLKPLKQDQYLRTVWDRVPEPPPHGPKGADRITILYDPDENGRYRKSKDFVTGLNLATGFCIGHGGVYVVQPPYLLFYPDKNGDDVPDSDPEVLVKGFGMEDTHSYANSLQWGPDGWLYGAHGSTVTAHINGLEFQQGIWRFHPITKEFELFAEGGGNTYGLDFDKYGRAIAGTNWGGFAMLHQVQGGYYVKGFAKHGPLHNAHTYGYFDHVPYEHFKGGHVTCGGIVYQADAYPAEFRDQYIAGNLLSNAVYWHQMTPKGSSFTAKHGGDLLVANDTWFRPVDCFLGPDGSVYVADWYDKRAAHLDPVDNWDKTNGRVYRIEYKGTKQPEPFDLGKKSSAELVELLKHPNKWWRNEARGLLAERRDAAVVPALKKLIDSEKGLLALEAFWALYVTTGLDDDTAAKLLHHDNEHVRAWVVRLLGDRPKTRREYPNYSPPGADVSVQLTEQLVELAKRDPSPTVRSQLACTAKRLDRTPGIRLALALAQRDEDVNDPHIPLLIWWALEPHFAIPALATQHISDYSSKMMKTHLVERIARRTAASDLAHAAQPDRRSNPDPPEVRRNNLVYTFGLLERPKDDITPLMLRGVEQALDGHAFDVLLPNVKAALDRLEAQYPNDENLFRIRVRFNQGEALCDAHNRASDPKRPEAERVKLIALLGQVHRPESLPVLLQLFRVNGRDSIRAAALNAAFRYGGPEVEKELLTLVPTLSGGLRTQALAVAFSRPATALEVLQLVEGGKLTAKDLGLEQLRPLTEFQDERINKIVEKHWGKLARETPGEKQARISWLNIALGRGTGNATTGKAIFTKTCAVCHTLFGEGGKVGPDLTTADRKNRGAMLTNIVDPSGYIRPEYLAYNVTTADGRRLSGLVAESSGETVTLVNVVNDQPQKTVLARGDIEQMAASPVSLMPEKMLDTLSDQEVRDLFAYLQLDQPPVPTKPQTASGNGKLKVLLISGSLEYKSDESLSEFQKYLEANFPVECSRAFRKADDDLPGLEGLETCDVALFFTRRLTIKGEQLERVKKYALSGKPIVAIRTASHGFQNWLDMDKEVLGGNYKNHYKAGPKCEVKITDAGKEHPVLRGLKPFTSSSSLYMNPDLPKDDVVLLTGSIPQHTEPVAWVRNHKGGRVFYTSLGHMDDFKDDNFIRMVVNALFWSANREVPAAKK
jgi:putative membrane-bound dehydrogenase-like protein